jgi:5-carboxymethyl-2-hydroxymuconate isomerase
MDQMKSCIGKIALVGAGILSRFGWLKEYRACAKKSCKAMLGIVLELQTPRSAVF